MALAGTTRALRQAWNGLDTGVSEIDVGAALTDVTGWCDAQLGAAYRAALASEYASYVGSALLGGFVLFVAWRLLRPQTAAEVIGEYEEEMNVHVVWLVEQPWLEGSKANASASRSAVLGFEHLELPNPDGMAEAAMRRVAKLRAAATTFKGTAIEYGTMMWRDFLLPVVMDGAAIKTVLDDLKSNRQNVMTSRRHEFRCLLCLLWSVVMPCVPTLPGGGTAWIRARGLLLKSGSLDKDITFEDVEAQAEAQLMFFQTVANMMRVVLQLGNDVLGIRQEDRTVMWRAFKDYALVVRHELGEDDERVSSNHIRATGSASAADRRRFSSKAATPQDEAELLPWKYFELEDKGSVFYIRGLEDVEQTEGLFDVMEAEDDPEPEEKEENVD